MRAHEIPGYVQGHRFSDESEVFYDADNLKFKDLSGYGDFLDLEITVGTPAFEDTGANNRRGMLLDKQAQGRFIPAAPWETTVVFAIYVELLTSGTQVRYPHLFGTLTNEGSNGNIRAQHFSGNRVVAVGTTSDQSKAEISQGTDGIIIAAVSFDQSTRKTYDTVDGVAINESAALADEGHGSALAIGAGGAGTFDDIFCRFGDLVGDGSTTAETDLKIVALEHHFFAGNVISSHQSEIEALLAEMATYYGV